MDQALRLDGHHPDFRNYPQDIDLLEVVKSIRRGMPVHQHPINDPELFVIQTPKWTCSKYRRKSINVSGKFPLDVIVLIKSCAACFKNRAHARSTYMQPHLWGSFRVQFAFVVGLPCLQTMDRLNLEGVDVTIQDRRITDEVRLKRTVTMIYKESETFEDLLIGSFHDTYYNLTLKRILTFRWAFVFCQGQAPLFLFIDDDISIIPENLVKFVRKIPHREKLFFNGGCFGSNPVVPRPDGGFNQWAVSEDEFPWKEYPPYSLGAGNLVGAEMVVDAAIAMAFTRFLRMDDVFTGIVWKKLNYPTLGIPGFRLQISSAREMSDTIITFTDLADKYMDWKSGKIGSTKK
ncbi:unnamed protein product [Calicophoron daubneyi]|uniref:Hexosyltransferase n=1 Tax=Calicophoron daubneyi TaxID=300641 RepID=A0AAV2TN81_CALDB